MTAGEHRNALPPGYRLHWYVIRDVLGQGGFGITYLAEDANLNHPVAIKEYLPVEAAVREGGAAIHPLSGEYGDQYRWGLDRFVEEARTLAQFKHAHIVRVLTVFTENNSAYMVMELETGRGLHEILKERRTLSLPELQPILHSLLDGLEQVHARGFIHRDIKPANIQVRPDGGPVLLDFGSARQALGEATRTVTAMVSPGFAPFEQYTGRGERQGAWTDIYGLGATLYRAAVGRAPADAMDRSEALLHTGRDAYVKAAEIAPAGYSAAFLDAIDAAMAFKAADRPQSIGEWRRLFDSEGKRTVVTVPAPEAEAPPGDSVKIVIEVPADGTPELRTNRLGAWSWPVLGVAAGVLVMLLVAVFGRSPALSHVDGPPAQSSRDEAAVSEELPSDPVADPRAQTSLDNVAAGGESEAPVAAAEVAVDQDPASDTRRAFSGTDRIEARLRQAMREGNYDSAETLAAELLAISPGNRRVLQMQDRIRRQKSNRR